MTVIKSPDPAPAPYGGSAGVCAGAPLAPTLGQSSPAVPIEYTIITGIKLFTSAAQGILEIFGGE